MHRTLLLSFIVATAAIAAEPEPVATKTRAALAAVPELQPIFNGRDLTGWQPSGSAEFWRVEDGVLVGENDAALTGSMLRSEKTYGDFELEFDVRWAGEIDSGIEFREPVIQLQLGVSRSLKRDMSGSLYVGKPGYPEPGRANSAAALMKPEGKWNTFRLRAQGPVFTVWINGTQAVQFTDEGFSGAAPIGIQIHGGLKMKVEYRHIRLAEL
ncbi:MAG TPA: DUF1080 domain-containing protein [Opitutaceae bacterium]|nr:DUF1080 domain-containing protein [Opitutaceae bacterium]